MVRNWLISQRVLSAVNTILRVYWLFISLRPGSW